MEQIRNQELLELGFWVERDRLELKFGLDQIDEKLRQLREHKADLEAILEALR
jgi:hypothetical protein